MVELQSIVQSVQSWELVVREAIVQKKTLGGGKLAGVLHVKYDAFARAILVRVQRSQIFRARRAL